MLIEGAGHDEDGAAGHDGEDPNDDQSWDLNAEHERQRTAIYKKQDAEAKVRKALIEQRQKGGGQSQRLPDRSFEYPNKRKGIKPHAK